MRQKLINTYKFSELSTSIQDKKIEDYLERNTQKIMQDLAIRFCQDKGFMNVTTWIEPYYGYYYLRTTLITSNLVLLNSFFSIPDHEKIESIEFESHHMVDSCVQPEVTVIGIDKTDAEKLEARLELYWADCCTEFVTLLRKELAEDTIKAYLVNLDHDYLETGALIP